MVWVSMGGGFGCGSNWKGARWVGLARDYFRQSLSIEITFCSCKVYEILIMPFDVFQSYKPLRNKIALLSVEDALAVVWAYCQYLQVDRFRFPQEIEVDRGYLEREIRQPWRPDWK